MTVADEAFLTDLYRLPGNSLLAPSPAIENPGFVNAVRGETWANPMVLSSGSRDVAVAMLGAVDTQHRHGRLVFLAVDPVVAREALSRDLRQGFWGHPLHRLYAILPASAPLYSRAYEGCGFKHEGRLQRHLRVGAKLLDLEMYGLLRSDFDAWCAATDPRLAL